MLESLTLNLYVRIMLLRLTLKITGVNMTNEILHMKINKELKDRLRLLAEQDGRNLSNLIQKVLSDYAAQKEGELRSPRYSSRPKGRGFSRNSGKSQSPFIYHAAS